jgi:hypothetical protein
MRSSLHRHFTLGGTFSGTRGDPLMGLAGWLTLGVAVLAGGYFAFVCLVAGH